LLVQVVASSVLKQIQFFDYFHQVESRSLVTNFLSIVQ
jgi:hypothetical protein